MRGKKPQKQVLKYFNNKNLAALFIINLYQEYAKEPQFLVLAGTKQKHFHFQENICRKMSKALFIYLLNFFSVFLSFNVCKNQKLILTSQY